MHNNQKLALTGLLAFGACFGAWYFLQGPAEVDAKDPVSPRMTKQQDTETRRQRQLNMDFAEVPEEHKGVEKGIEDRWGHLGEEVLTAATVEEDGEMLYYDKKVISGVDGDGNPIFAQGAHRAFVMEGPTIREVTREPVMATIKPSKAPGTSYLFEALGKGGQKNRKDVPLPEPKTPASGS
mgnify:CR=1 FL=1